MTGLNRLSARARRRLALALLAGLLLMIYAGVVMPYFALYGNGIDRVAALQDLLARYRAAAEMRKAIEEHLSAQAADSQMSSNFLSSRTPALALADLQRYIKLTVEQSGAQLLSTQALPIADDSGLITATIRVGLRGDNESVQALLHRLEAQQPLAHIDNVSMRGMAKTASAARRGQSLDMRFELTSYVRLERP
jgi:general secretion pathway protein M